MNVAVLPLTTIWEFPEQAVTISGTVKVICWLETVSTSVTVLPHTSRVNDLDESMGNPLPTRVAVTPPPGLLVAGVIEPTFKLMV